ncbi:hypothetical protein PhaeoP75_01961 [Phaeobacter gallaeciensis]|uniref:Uncharacterized protein n=2 Tax=Phaeobacter gallaeciensis TaxID=60890 RepID=A0AAC9Z811_9RHOB|nr:hypothetical protein Gal_01920 [Phaeobacter gallaeciensis DSM 26640]ATE92936.1 hypothetical protein PhaeoP11_01911 [Phaeobacter gallaeciensis]ATE97242.1 hypothetical protein PhaeoP73_01935 [Phaeobacter gallaeciensis]ATF01601.1 hypothetical protein PhaeoP75_01961 [Phaeobacter gallaeciensis]ATF05981.1 hypothetical protein PhaeoP63_01909 [Phaeobacter gallaeciensis]
MTEAAVTVNSIVLPRNLQHNHRMFFAKHTFVALILVSGLAACGPVPVYYRAGADVARRDADLLSCEVSALRDAPVATQIRQHPPIYRPGGEICRNGRCYHRAGYWEDGGIYTVDVNADLRERVEQSCMASKGYQSIALKRCPQSVADAVGTRRASSLPVLTETSCAIARRGQPPQIVATAP